MNEVFQISLIYLHLYDVKTIKNIKLCIYKYTSFYINNPNAINQVLSNLSIIITKSMTS